MIRIEVGLRDFLMTAPALLHDFQLEPLRIGPLDRVGGVTVVAHRERLVRFSDLGDMDTLLELLLNAQMTPAARSGNIGRVDAGSGIRHGKLAVRRVAVGAGSSHRQAAFEQPFAMDALLVSLNDLVLRARVSHGGFVPFAMAAGAQVRDIRGKDGRFRIFPSADAMRAMAFVARWRIGVVPCKQLSMNALLVLLTWLCMTGSAINLPRDRLTGPPVGRIHL